MAPISSEKIDLLIYGPIRPILENGFSDQYVLHKAESRGDLERLTMDTMAKIRGIAVTYHTMATDKTAMALFPKLEIVGSFGVGYDHVDSAYARDHNIVVTNTPDVLTEEVADVAMGLLIATLREFVKADRYVRSGLWQTQNYPLSVGSLRDRKIGIVGMGRIGQAIGRRLEASRVPVSYHSRNPSKDVSYKHYPDLIEMAKAVDTLIVIVPGGASTTRGPCAGSWPITRETGRPLPIFARSNMAIQGSVWAMRRLFAAIVPPADVREHLITALRPIRSFSGTEVRWSD